MKDLQSYLQKITPISQQEWDLVSQKFKKEDYKKDDFFLKEGAYCNKVAFVSKGLFKLYHTTERSERILLFFEENQFLADYYGYLTQTPSIRPIKAVEDSVVYTIYREHLDFLIANTKAWSNIARIMAERAYILSVQRANRLLHDDPDTRFLTFMSEHPTLLQRLPQYTIASYLDMTPETLSRVKKRTMKQPIRSKSSYQSIPNLNKK